jgi:hypothetical protein
VRLWRALGTVSYINIIEGYTRTRESSEPSNIDLIFTNEDDMVDRIVHESPLGRSDHCALLFKFNCYYEIKGNAIQRWNFYKGDYTEMAKKMDSDWKNTLSEKKTQTHPLSYSLKLSRERKRNVYQNVAVKLGPKQKNTTTYHWTNGQFRK